MTKEEAIKVIETIEKRFIVTLDKEELQALDMSIDALKNVPKCISNTNIKTHYFRDDYCPKGGD